MKIVFLVVAILCFILQALNITSIGKFQLGWIGLAFFAGAFIV